RDTAKVACQQRRHRKESAEADDDIGTMLPDAADASSHARSQIGGEADEAERRCRKAASGKRFVLELRILAQQARIDLLLADQQPAFPIARRQLFGQRDPGREMSARAPARDKRLPHQPISLSLRRDCWMAGLRHAMLVFTSTATQMPIVRKLEPP